ncbi:hypothetical protein C1645_825731 [Glomus cerebriforme]|uniref:Protein kinase domain-containing protein n=1 Tax=Glomus cerebriforme TaxID=658196 RepID=A0A397SRP3_9GLOM|nr:hypothetical protein C1645_825731 [Glomus cerebriforme]
MGFVPYNKFENIEFITEEGFSKIYKANSINDKMKVALKELNNSENIKPYKDLNESFDSYYINEYYGITQHPITKNYMIIMKKEI